MNIRTSLTAIGATLTLATSILGFASPASAASARDGICDSGEFCYFYNSNQAGSVSDFAGSLGEYGATLPSCYVFKGAGNGKDVCVKNNAASVWNRTGSSVRVYFNSNFAGASQTFAPGEKGNLNATLKNNNASHQLVATGDDVSPPAERVDAAVQYATARLGHTDWNNQCELFVEKAYGTSGQFGSAIEHYQWQNAHGRIHTGTVPPAGAVVFFTSTTRAGHVMLSIGDNKAISTGSAVYLTDSFRDRDDYLGWAYVPLTW